MQRPQTEESPPAASLPASAIERLAASLAHAASPSEAVKEHLAVAQDLGEARLVFLSVLDSEKNLLAVVASRGRVDEHVQAARPGVGLVGRAFASGQPLELEGHLAVPSSAGPLRAVLSVVGARTPVAREAWRALADHAAAAVQVAELRDAALRRTRDLETAVAGLKNLERARDELLGNVSHELKNPLTTIKAYLAMARSGRIGEVGEKLRHAYDVCDRNADRLLRLINDMLLMNRLQSGRMTLDARPFGLRSLAQEAAGSLAAMASTAEVSLELERLPEVFVKGDRDRLHEALVHLLENAIIYNRKGGRVSMRATSQGGVAVLELSDTGEGIPPEDLPFVFDRFFRGSRPGPRAGSGLGLAIVRQIVALHGGSVTARSEPEKGSTFTIKLPLFAGAVSDSSRAAERRDGAILIVEDDADCREVLAQVLESEGHGVLTAADAASAQALLSASRPALVLLDLRLGQGDGRAVLQTVRGDPRLASTPVFVVSGAADSAAGFSYDGPERIDAFFEKPLNLPRLLDRIQEVVRPRQAAEES